MSDEHRPLEIALIGCGNWGKNILRDLVQCGARVSVVAHSAECVERAKVGRADRILSTIEQLGEIDGAIVATPTLTHIAVIEGLLRTRPGLPVYSEKPIGLDPNEADRIASRYADNVFVMHKWRYHPGILALRDIAKGGELGPVHGLRLIRGQWGHPPRDVNAVATLIPHDLSITLEVLGHVPVPRAAVADWVSGGAAVLSAQLGTSPWVTLHASAREFENRREAQLYCRDGVARLSDAYGTHIDIVRTESVAPLEAPTLERREVSDVAPLLLQVQAFLAFVRGEGPAPKGSAAEEAGIVRIADTLRKMATQTVECRT